MSLRYTVSSLEALARAALRRVSDPDQHQCDHAEDERPDDESHQATRGIVDSKRPDVQAEVGVNIEGVCC